MLTSPSPCVGRARGHEANPQGLQLGNPAHTRDVSVSTIRPSRWGVKLSPCVYNNARSRKKEA